MAGVQIILAEDRIIVSKLHLGCCILRFQAFLPPTTAKGKMKQQALKRSRAEAHTCVLVQL